MAKPDSRKAPIYENYAILHPDGHIMFRAGRKRALWYVERGLAELVTEEPPVYKLKFVPDGMGHLGDSYYIEPKENKCVVCGSENYNKLTRHHVVPYEYRRYLPDRLKNHNYHDILPVCTTCHGEYERHADQLKHQLAEEYDAPIRGETVPEDYDIKRVRGAAIALRESWHQIPFVRREELIDRIRAYWGKDEITPEDFEKCFHLKTHKELCKPHGQEVADKITDHNGFVLRWRRHFIDTMNPRFLPALWDVNRSAV